MKILLVMGGFFTLAFFVFHALFWKLFNWNEDLKTLSPLNRGVMQILNLCLMVVFLVFGLLSIFHPDEMLSTALGAGLLSGIAGLWFFRAILQIVFFKLKSRISIMFFWLFLLGGLLYAVPLIA
ncbi:MAG: hypothetical protein OEQ28_03900 [Acidobacteriota bacterium]|nr:hypothetical protein [Acidobacteriota bacterium]